MSNDFPPINSMTWQQQASQWLAQGQYGQAASCYEQAIASEPEVKPHYWYMGLALLLDGQEAEAHTAWMAAMMEGEPDQLETWTLELAEVLRTEAAQREAKLDYAVAWLIRQHLREIVPDDFDNLQILVLLAIELGNFDPEGELIQEFIDRLQANPVQVNLDLLYEVLHRVVTQFALAPWMPRLAEACIPQITEPDTYIDIVLGCTTDIAYVANQPALAAHLAELCLQVDPDHVEVLSYLSAYYQAATEYDKGIVTARRYADLVTKPSDRVFANHLILRGLTSSAGRWEEGFQTLQQHQVLLNELTQQTDDLEPRDILRLITTTFFFPYFRDDLKENRKVHNWVGQLYHDATHQVAADQMHRFRQQRNGDERSDRRLRIGYLSHCMNRHSVGWLARSLIQHHDRDRFELFGYFVNARPVDSVQDWYANQMSHVYKSTSTDTESIWKVAQQIAQDEIDILIELDSITLDLSCHIVALKPAPIQVTWLGWDASGIPAVDYFIADPYVLPDWAEDHYREKLWRLPQSYIGLDGFEVAIPSLHRQDLGIPQDALVYYCVQNSYKRHPAISRRQIQVLRQVPNSHLLIKGIADETTLKRFFLNLAEEEGVDPKRLHFLQGFATEAMHRASLRLADVVLDTYPYNGATTTLETLWMEVPLVTRVGEHFSSRNSYTMLKNVGVEEGIAWSDDEYVDWAVRLGTDSLLRQQVAWKLRQAKHNAPLWNGKQFTRHMEQAYEQMWAIHLEKAGTSH